MLREEFPDAVFGEASSAQEALEKAWADPWDLIVLDISMPDVSGIAVMRALQGSHSRIPVVMVTQHTTPAYIDAAFDSGASGYVTKPRMLIELCNALREARAGGRYLSEDIRAS
jgi:DNA-binding NarL/FixJ family response regulator